MSIANLPEKGKQIVENNAVYSALLVIVVGCAAFGLGKLSEEPVEVEAVAIEHPFPAPELQIGGEEDIVQIGSMQPENGQFVASRSGSKYHFPWCPGAQQMKDSNKIWFATKEDAEKAGYEPAANCKGL